MIHTGLSTIVWRSPVVATRNPYGAEIYRLAQAPFQRLIIHMDLSFSVWRIPLLASHSPYGSRKSPSASYNSIVWRSRFWRRIIHMDLNSIVWHSPHVCRLIII